MLSSILSSLPAYKSIFHTNLECSSKPKHIERQMASGSRARTGVCVVIGSCFMVLSPADLENQTSPVPFGILAAAGASPDKRAVVESGSAPSSPQGRARPRRPSTTRAWCSPAPAHGGLILNRHRHRVLPLSHSTLTTKEVCWPRLCIPGSSIWATR